MSRHLSEQVEKGKESVLLNLKREDEHVYPDGMRGKNGHLIYYSERKKFVKLVQSLDVLGVPNVDATGTSPRMQ